MQSHFKAISVAALGLGISFSAGNGEIVGGQSIPITEAPWQLWIGNCGATWVGGRNVITAQHCINSKTPANTFVWAGITRRNEATTATRIAVAQIIKKATSTDLSQDIAILKLAADIPATSKARPIRYATAADATAGYTNKGVDCMATGWGGVDRNVTMPDSLQRVMSKIYNTPTNPTGVIRWAGQGGTANVGSCQGDSGGPLVVKDGSGNWILAGASSYIQSFCGDPANPSSYSRVSAFADWILQNGVPQPGIVSLADHRVLPPLDHGFFSLDRGQNVTMAILDLNGSTVSRSAKFYGAGRHVLPGGSTGGHILRLTGESIDTWHWLPALTR